MISLLGFPKAGATLSPCGRYRYRLWRRWAPGETVLWVMLNPSTAAVVIDDPTIRKCMGFAKLWGYGAIDVVNLYAWRATHPRDLPRDPCTKIGPDNHVHVEAAVSAAVRIVAAWGANAPQVRADEMRAALGDDVQCLGLTAGGQPRHPLMLAYSTALETFP